ncbi:hypothetical protein AHiyo6_30980, partial [Arthrobacter sp. Hiyo6]
MNGQHDAPVPEATQGSERNPAAAGQQAPLSQPAPQYRTHPQADQPAPVGSSAGTRGSSSGG